MNLIPTSVHYKGTVDIDIEAATVSALGELDPGALAQALGAVVPACLAAVQAAFGGSGIDLDQTQGVTVTISTVGQTGGLAAESTSGAPAE